MPYDGTVYRQSCSKLRNIVTKRRNCLSDLERLKLRKLFNGVIITNDKCECHAELTGKETPTFWRSVIAPYAA
jgi:hypothetical protein